MTAVGAVDGGRATRLAAWAVAVLAAASTVYVTATLAVHGFWLDDLYTIAASDPQRPFAEMLRRYLLPETNPPLHYILIRWWRMVSPDDEFWLRVPGLVAYVLTIVAAAFYPCRALRTEERVVLAGLMAVGFGPIYFASELRPYAVLALLSLTYLLDAVAVLDALARGEAAPPGRMLTMVVSGWILSFEHYFGFLFAGSVIAGLLGLGLWGRTWSWRVFAVGVAIAAGFVPWLTWQLPVIGRWFGGGFWIEFDPIGAARGVIRHTLTAAVPAALLAAGIAWALWRTRGAALRDRRIALTAIAAALNVVIPVVVSLHTPLLNGRYFTCLRTLVFFGLALLLAPLLRDRRGAAFVVATLAALLVAYPWAMTLRASWREPSAYVQDMTDCARRDIIAISTLGGADIQRLEPMYRFYLADPRFRFTIVPIGDPVDGLLATLNPTGPGCDVVAMATNLDPTRPELRAPLIAALPFAAPGYEIRHWPSAFVVRRVAR